MRNSGSSPVTAISATAASPSWDGATDEPPGEDPGAPLSGPAGGYRPVLEGLHAEFFRLAATTGELHIQQCAACAAPRHPPRHFCPRCFSPDWTFVPVAGFGHVHSAVVVHRPFGPAPTTDLPYAAVIVELDEGPRVIGVGQDSAPTSWTAGRRVQIVVQPSGETFASFHVVVGDD